MNAAKKVLEKAQVAGKVREREEYLRLAPKNEQGVPTPNGPHKVKLISDKIGTNNMGEQQLQVVVVEGKHQKLWTMPLKDKEGNLHYLVQALADYEPGDELIVEMKKNGAKSYVDVRKVGEMKAGDEVPSINLDEDSEDVATGGDEEEGGDDSAGEEVPF